MLTLATNLLMRIDASPYRSYTKPWQSRLFDSRERAMRTSFVVDICAITLNNQPTDPLHTRGSRKLSVCSSV